MSGVSLEIKLDNRFKKRLAGRFEKYDFEVGILNDKPYKKAKLGEKGKQGRDVIGQYAGGPVRNKTRQDSGISLSQISAENRDRLGYNYLSEPFKKKSSDIIKFSNEFFKLAFGRSEKKRCENLLQAIVRNPILRGEVGSNSALTQRIKGFNRPMIDTAQTFKAILSRCNVRK